MANNIINQSSTLSVHVGIPLRLPESQLTTPDSKKMFNTVYTSVFPLIQSSSAYSSNLSVVFRPQIQPWHPSSTLCIEAATAVLLLAPDQFWQFSHALFDKQTEFFDVNVVNEKRNDTYKRLAEIAGGVSVDKVKLLELLTVADKPDKDGALNVGNGVTNDVKKMVKVSNLAV
jgi:hypothetical protein